MTKRSIRSVIAAGMLTLAVFGAGGVAVGTSSASAAPVLAPNPGPGGGPSEPCVHDGQTTEHKGRTYVCQNGEWQLDEGQLDTLPMSQPRNGTHSHGPARIHTVPPVGKGLRAWSMTTQGNYDGPTDVLSDKCHFEGQGGGRDDQGRPAWCHNGKWVPVGSMSARPPRT